MQILHGRSSISLKLLMENLEALKLTRADLNDSELPDPETTEAMQYGIIKLKTQFF